MQDEWDELYAREEEYWCQKYREYWLHSGDQNTKFFHASAMHKATMKTIFSIKDSCENILTDLEDIRDQGVKFFSDLLAPPPPSHSSDGLLNSFLDAIPNSILA